MALLFIGKTTCLLCRKIFNSNNDIISFPAFSPKIHRLSEYSDGRLNLFRSEFWRHVLPHQHIYDLRNAPATLNANWRTTFQNLGARKTTTWWGGW
jgi:hypothetical protein